MTTGGGKSADAVAFRPDVVAETGALATVGRQEAAEHTDGGRLAGAVEPDDADAPLAECERQWFQHDAAVDANPGLEKADVQMQSSPIKLAAL